MANCLEKGLGQFAGGLAKNRDGVFDTHRDLIMVHARTQIGLADESALNFDQSFLLFNAKKKINVKKSSRFKMLNIKNYQLKHLIHCYNNANFTMFLSKDNFS